MASALLMELLCQEMMCPVCLDYFKEPVILDCGHSVCQGCLAQYQRGFGMAACCPQCPEKDQRESFRPNWQLAKVVELVKKLQGGERDEQQMCARHEAPLELFCKEDQVPICGVCKRSKAHRGHSICPREEEEEEKEVATKAFKISCSKAGSHCKAIHYLKMREIELMERCQEKGLDREGLSVDELRIVLIQQASQLETVRLNAKGTKACGTELKAQRNGGLRERKQFRMLRKKQKKQFAAQVEERKRELGRLYLKEKQANKPIPWVFPPFFPGENPALFLAAFERTSKQWGMSVEDSMRFLLGLIRGELAEIYHSMSSQRPVSLEAFKEAVFNQVSFNPDHFCEEFWALRPQPGVSFLEFGAKLEETLNWWLDTAKADDREKVIRLMALNQFYSHLPDEIKHSVKVKAPENISQAAEIADQLMLSREGSERRAPHLARHQGRLFPTNETAENPMRTKMDSLSVEHKMSLNVTSSQQFKRRACYSCGKTGHLQTSCPSSSQMAYRVTACFVPEDLLNPTKLCTEPVLIGGELALALLSTGSEINLVRSDLVTPYDIVPGESVVVKWLDGTCSSFPVACLQLTWRDTKGLVDFGVVETLLVPVLIGVGLLRLSRVSFFGKKVAEKPKASSCERLPGRSLKKGNLATEDVDMILHQEM